MERRCENCGQPALASDTACWHCGWQLVEEGDAESLDLVTVRQGWQQPANLSAILVYATLTAVVILMTLFVMGWLGRRPLIDAGSEGSLPGEWREIMPADQSYTFNLPENWLHLDGSERLEAPELAALLESDEIFQAATFPLGEELADLAIVMVAATPMFQDNEAFLIVATSRGLGTLAQEDVTEFLREAEFDNSLVLALETADTGESWPVKIAAEVIGEAGDQLHRCQQELLVRGDIGWLVSACTPSLDYHQYEQDLITMLDSFQPLARD